MNDTQTEAAKGWSPMMYGGIALAAVALVLVILPTCKAPTNVTDLVPEDDTSATDVSLAQCERSLLSAIDGLQPSRLDMSSESRVMADTLNSWRKQCLPESSSFASEDDQTLRESLLTGDGLARSDLDRYQIRDAEHVRNSLLAKAIVDHVAADARSDLQRAVELYYYVVRTVDLIPDGAIDLRVTPHESLLFGTGTAADRAWTYALLLRQLRLDCVMIQPRTQDDSAYWLIGAIIPGEGVFLFDPRLGLPIIGDDDQSTALPRQPVTLKQVRENDKFLRQFDTDESTYPLTAESLQSVDVFAIGTSSTFAPRMGELQATLPEPVEIYDGLASNSIRTTGLIERLVVAGGDGLWSEDRVHVWPYPETRWRPMEELSDEQRQLLEGRMKFFAGPYSISAMEDDDGNVVPIIEPAQRSLRRARIEQLMGNFDAAQQVYLQARLSFQGVQQVNLPEVQINFIISDMATFWAAQCQYEQEDFRVAAQSALNYMRRPNGQFLITALYLASVSLAQNDRAADAAAVLAQQPSQSQQYAGNQRLIARWREQGQEDTETTSQPATPDEADSKTEEMKKESKPTDKSDKPAKEDSSKATETPEPEQKDAAAPQEGDDKPADGDKPSTPAEPTESDDDSSSTTEDDPTPPEPEDSDASANE